MVEEEREEEMEQGSSLCPLLNMEPHLLDRVLGVYRVMMARRGWENVLHMCDICNPRLLRNLPLHRDNMGS